MFNILSLAWFDPQKNAQRNCKKIRSSDGPFSMIGWVVDRLGLHNKLFNLLFIPLFGPQKNAMIPQEGNKETFFLFCKKEIKSDRAYFHIFLG